jgi:Ca2+-binding EF-hand superfamily protein
MKYLVTRFLPPRERDFIK